MAGISQAELARQLGVNKSTITYHVKRGLTHAQIRELIKARRKENPAVEAAASGVEKNAPVAGEGVAELRKKKLAAEVTYK
ncbi:winged helix-turn-helix transcriptional regulator, partial [Akkermansia sp.]